MHEPIILIEIPAFDVTLTNVKFLYLDKTTMICAAKWVT